MRHRCYLAAFFAATFFAAFFFTAGSGLVFDAVGTPIFFSGLMNFGLGGFFLL